MTNLATADPTVDNAACEGILQDLLQYTLTDGPNGKQCLNMYDVRLKDTYPSCGMNWPPDLVNVTPYLRRQDVLEALHVGPNKNTGWQECSGAVGANFRASNSKPSVVYLPDILTEVPIVLFSGAEDLICNHLGTEALIGNMEWNGGKGFETAPGTWAPRRDWTFEGEPAGFWQEARNLTYVLFYNSSHMVPFDYARRTRDMLDRFMGVDISSIGGAPTDSRLDGEKGPETTVGGAAGNGTAAQEAEKEKLDAAKWQAYRKSGEIVLVIVIIAAGLWGWYVWRDRRRRSGYQGVAGSEGLSGNGRATRGGGLEGFRHKRNGAAGGRDVEAQDFDESELDDLHVATPTDGAHDERYSVGEDSDDEHAGKGEKKERNGQAGVV
jgi:carboxypeptidase D